MPRRLSPEEQARIKRIQDLEKDLKKILLNTFSLSFNFPEVQRAFRDANDLFSFRKNKTLLKKLVKILNANYKNFNATIINSIQKEFQITSYYLWKGLEKKYVKNKDQVKAFDTIRTDATKSARSIVEQAREFTTQKRGGLDLSKRIWKTFENIPKEIDVIIQNAIKEGKSADIAARELQKNLLEPDRLYRRVTNAKTGKLEWSKAAQEYHPGQGVYRSSYKNAMRLARTEITRASHTAEWNGYQNNPMIIGFRIVLSENTENQCEVCKRLAGVYPKWFKWTGWHPQCRCRMIPIMLSDSDWSNLLKLRFAGKENDFKPSQVINMPQPFIDYLQESSERISNAATLPYWYEDNLGVLQDSGLV